jgi:hypothetical protein
MAFPTPKPLRQGDIVNVDVTLIVDGWHGDSSRMYPVGEVKRAPERLMEVTYLALMRGIAAVKPGNRTGDIGAAIQTFAEAERCSVVRDFCGHGIGDVFHLPPNILHYGRPGEGVDLRPGMIFTIEPMINLGRPHVKILSDGWTAVTRDRSLSAQYEHSIGVTEEGCEIFTASPGRAVRAADPARGSGGSPEGCQSADVGHQPPGQTALPRSPGAIARALCRRRCGRLWPIMNCWSFALSLHPAPRHQAARQGSDRTLRFARRCADRTVKAQLCEVSGIKQATANDLALVRAAAECPGARQCGAERGPVLLVRCCWLLPRCDGL